MNVLLRTSPGLATVALLLAMVLTLSCVSSNRTWIDPRVARLDLEGWHELTSADFILYSHGTKEDLETFALDLARFVAVVERLVKAESPKTPARLVIVDERAEELFVPFSWQEAYIGRRLGGFNGFVRGGRYDPTIRSVLLHEYTHYLTLRNTRLDYPIWYREGLAEFLGPIRARGDTMEVGSRPPGRLDTLKARHLRKEEIDLSEIFSYTRAAKTFYPSDFYAISWATVHYLNSTREGQRRLAAMVEEQARGVHWEKAYSHAFSEPIEVLSKKVEHHAELLNKGTPAAVLYLPFEALDIRNEWTLVEMTPIEVARLLGEFSAHGAVYAGNDYTQRLAERLFERALEMTPNDSRTHAGLASALAQQGRFEEAERHLASFKKDPSPSVTALTYAAYAIQKHAESLEGEERVRERSLKHSTAIDLYLRALVLEPENPFALAGLGHGQLETGQFESARESLAKAQFFGEWDAALTLDRALIEKETGSSGRARAFWKEVMRLGTEDQAKTAAALLAVDKMNEAR